MKKQSNRIKIEKLVARANRRFKGKWMAAEDMSYIFPVDAIVFRGKYTDEVPDDPEEVPLGIRVRKFINSVGEPIKLDDIVETSARTCFDDNPYRIASYGAACGRRGAVMFIPKAKARQFAANIVRQLDRQRRRMNAAVASGGIWPLGRQE